MKKVLLITLMACVLGLFLLFQSASARPLQAGETYHSYSSLKTDLTNLANLYPSLAKLYVIGTTAEGRDLMALKISDNVATSEKENQILFVGNHHAREWISVEVPYLLAKYLLENYAAASVKALVDNQEIWIVPMLNPDGLEYTTTAGNRLWRKNRHIYPPSFPLFPTCYGVDLNRNYGASSWGSLDNSYSSKNCHSWGIEQETYIGPSSFSEAETQAVRNFFQQHAINAVLSYHSFSQKILYPWGYTSSPISNSMDRTFMEKMAGTMRDKIYQVHQQAYVPQASSSMYATAGDLTDWAYEVYGIPALTIELRPTGSDPGFVLPTDQILPTFEENLPAAMALLQAFQPEITTPTTARPLSAGSSAAPRKIFIDVKGFGKGKSAADFQVKIGGAAAQVISATATDVNAYKLGVMPPTRPSDGLYDLEVGIGGAKAVQAQAISYQASVNTGVVLVIDQSGSMGYSGYLESAKNSALQLVSLMQNNDQVGVVGFSDTSSVVYPLTKMSGGSASSLFSDTVEGSTGNWVNAGTWGMTTSQSHSPTHSWTDSPAGNYLNNSNMALTLNAPFNLTTLTNPAITFWTKYELESGYDYGWLEISTNGGASWTSIAAYNGSSAGWGKATVSLAGYKTAGSAYFRFRLSSDSSITYDGWYVDDIQIGEITVRDQIYASISAMQSLNNTSIGAGLQTASSQLASVGDPANSWAIILLSDGYENTSPMVSQILPQLISQKVRVYTIALGSNSDQVLLANIAAQTGGTYSYAPDVSALAFIYNNIAGQASGQQQVYSDQSSIAAGQTAEKVVTIDNGMYEAVFSISWADPTAPLSLVLVAPNGAVITPQVASQTAGFSYQSGPTFQNYRIAPAMAGPWKMRVTLPSVQVSDKPHRGLADVNAAAYTAQVKGFTNTTLTFQLDQASYHTGDKILVSATLSDQSSIKNASIHVQIIPPSGGNGVDLVLYDDGAHRDGTANDGVYANSLAQTAAAGGYQFNLKATGLSNQGYPFERVASLSAQVAVPPQPLVAVTGSAQKVKPGDVVYMTVRITNSGNTTDTFDLRSGDADIPSTWANASSVPAYVTLYAGQSVTYTLPVSVPATAVVGEGSRLPIAAISRTNPAVSSSGIVYPYVPTSFYLPSIR